jgi:hypothetical protein
MKKKENKIYNYLRELNGNYTLVCAIHTITYLFIFKNSSSLNKNVS